MVGHESSPLDLGYIWEELPLDARLFLLYYKGVFNGDPR